MKKADYSPFFVPVRKVELWFINFFIGYWMFEILDV
jgi:hypothetical protein